MRHVVSSKEVFWSRDSYCYAALATGPSGFPVYYGKVREYTTRTIHMATMFVAVSWICVAMGVYACALIQLVVTPANIR